MRPAEIRFISALVAAILGGTVWPLVYKDNRATKATTAVLNPEFLPLRSPRRQDVGKRRWNSWSWEKIGVLNRTHNVFRPGRVRRGPDNTLFVIDMGDSIVKQMSVTGRLVTAFSGQWTGRATDVAASENAVWVCDPNGRVTEFDRDGALKRLWPPNVRAFRIARTDQGLIVHSVTLTGEVLAAYDEFGNRIGAVEPLLSNQERTGVALFGFLDADQTSSRSVFYAAQYGGLLIRLDAEARDEFRVRLIDEVLLPPVQQMPSGAMRLSNDMAVSVTSIVASRDAVLVLLETDRTSHRRTVIDVYKPADGSYLYSVATPETWRSMDMAGNIIYAATDSEVSIWKVSGTVG